MEELLIQKRELLSYQEAFKIMLHNCNAQITTVNEKIEKLS